MAETSKPRLDIEPFREKVIRDLAKYRKPNDIIFELCDQTGQSWDEVAAFVRGIEKDSRGKIEAGRKPMYMAVALITTFIGLAVAITIIWLTLDGWVIVWFGIPIPWLPNIAILLLGVVMIVGGLRGIVQQLQRTPG